MGRVRDQRQFDDEAVAYIFTEHISNTACYNFYLVGRAEKPWVLVLTEQPPMQSVNGSQSRGGGRMTAALSRGAENAGIPD